MTAAARALLDRSLEAMGRGDIDAIMATYHPDVEVRDLSHPPDSPEVTRGREAVRAIFDQWLDMFDDWSIEVSGAMAADPWFVHASHWRATGKGSDAAVEWRVADAYEVRDGLIERVVWGYPDVDTALADLGLTATAQPMELGPSSGRLGLRPDARAL